MKFFSGLLSGSRIARHGSSKIFSKSVDGACTG
jgi:hypothetical protein